MSNPLFTVITPVFRPPPTLFAECVRSVRDQTFADWELVLVDDGNDDAELLEMLAGFESSHSAIRVVRSPTNVGIAGASQLGLAAATGEFVAFLDHDDLLTPDALERVAATLGSSSEVDYLYTDEDKLDENGEFYEPSFKPDWSPERFRSHMYACHLSVVRRTVALAVGGFRAGFDGSQDYDFILRVTERARSVVHLPEIHYHWRAHAGSTALSELQKPDAYVAAKRALTEHCQRVQIDADVLDGVTIGSYRIARRLTSHPLVSLIIPTRGTVRPIRGREEMLLEHFIKSIEARTTYDNFEYVVVHDARMSVDELAKVERACIRPLVTVAYRHDAASFNFSEAINRGATSARGEIFLLLNDDMELITPDWIEQLVALVNESDVGAVGGKYYFEDDTIQHAGVCLAGAPAHYFVRTPRGAQVWGLHLGVNREVSAVTGACLTVTRDDFLSVGGFTEQLPINYNDVDFCLKLRSRGLRNVWTPHVELYHLESQTREPGRVDRVESDLLARRWGPQLRRDPYYNPNLRGIWPIWEPYPDWRSVVRDWPRPAGSSPIFDAGAYLDANPDLAAAKAANPNWDVVEHFVTHGVREGRMQSVVLRRRVPGSA